MKTKTFFHVTIVLLNLLVLCKLNAQYFNVDNERDRMESLKIKSAKIKSITQYEHRYESGTVEKVNFVNLRQFDQNGNLLIDSNRSFNITMKNKYTSTGQIAERGSISYPKGLKLRETFEYDLKGNMVKGTTIEETENEASTVVYTYNQKGKPIEIFVIYGDGTIGLKEVLSYDHNGNEIKKIRYTSTGNFKDSCITEYDENGKKVKSVFYNSDGVITHSNFDQNGDIVKWVQYSGEKNYQHIYKYDQKRKRTEIVIYDPAGIVVYQCKTKNTYDENGNLTETINYDRVGNIVERFILEYDSNGNEIKRTKFKSVDRPESIVESVYEFYN